MRNLSSVAFIGFTFSALINLSSYFFHFALSFVLCIFLIFPIFAIAISVISKKLEINFNVLTIVLLFYAIGTLFIMINILDNFSVEKNGLDYILKNRATFIREATLEEYNLYKRRSSRLISAYLLFFYHLLYSTLKLSNSKKNSQ